VLSDCEAPSIISGESVETGETRIILRVDHALVTDSAGANVSGFTVGDQIVVQSINKAQALDPLGWRYREDFRRSWPQSYRFQSRRVNLIADVVSRDQTIRKCILQVAENPQDRTRGNVRLNVEDAQITASHAARYNQFMAQKMVNALDGQADEALPVMKVCAPVACEVVSTAAPNLLPRGSFCTVTVYPFPEIMKFVFDGADEYAEVPQGFFHFVMYASGGTDMVCDIQGYEAEDAFHILDPVVLGGNKSAMAQYFTTLAADPVQGNPQRPTDEAHQPSEQRFNQLHPKCGSVCRTFDPTRHGAKGKKGHCGITCMT